MLQRGQVLAARVSGLKVRGEISREMARNGVSPWNWDKSLRG